MVGEQIEGVAPAETQEIESICWRVRLSDSNPRKRYALIAAVLVAFIFGTVVYGKLLLGLLGSAMILAATAEFWLGTYYKLDSTGASSRTGFSLTKLAWPDVKRAVVTSVGVKLSPLEETTRLAPFRGIFLRFGREDRVRIENAVRTLGGENVRFVEGTAD